MLPEPNFPVRPNELVGRRREIDTFREALCQGLVKGRTSSFAVLGEWGIGKSSLLLKFADLCSEATFAMLPVFLSASNDIHDYLRFAESLLARPNLQARLRTEPQDWRFKPIHFGAVAFEHESPRRFLNSLLRHMLKEAWDHFLRPARLNGAIFFVDDPQNITSISKADLALIIRDQFQWFGIEMLNYCMCFSETLEYTRSVCGLPLDISEKVAAWLHEKTLGHPYFLACICKHLMATTKQIEAHKLETNWPVILDQLGREKFRSDISKLSAKELEFIHQFASLGKGELAAHRFSHKFERDYFARLVEKDLLIRTGRGRYKLYHPLFREFLQQTQ